MTIMFFNDNNRLTLPAMNKEYSMILEHLTSSLNDNHENASNCDHHSYGPSEPTTRTKRTMIKNQQNNNEIWSLSSNDIYYPYNPPSSSSSNQCSKPMCQTNSNINYDSYCFPRRRRRRTSTTNIISCLPSTSSIVFVYFPLLLLSILLILQMTLALDNNKNNNWRGNHRSQSSSSLKRLRSPSLSNHQHLNYSSSSNNNYGLNHQSSSKSQMANRRLNHHHHHGNHPINSPYYNSQLLSIPFPSTHQLLYQHPMLSQNYFHQLPPHLPQPLKQHQTSSPSSSSSTSTTTMSAAQTNPIQSNQIPRSINPLMVDGNMIPLKGTKWWDISRQSPTMMESMTLEQAQHMDGRHQNAIMPHSPPSVANGPQIMNTMNLPLKKKQRKLVRDNPGVLVAISRAMKMAINECQTQFKDRRWNCPVNDWKKGKNVFGKIIQRGCRETAFVYALTSAAVAHSIARACSEGLIETCTCDYRYNRKQSGTDWEWGGCSDNIDFGYKFARQFVDSAERGRDIRFLMNLHNNEAGRLLVSNEMRRECKCHGMSGSCTVKTCWMRLPSFRDIGNNLKDRFDVASRVSMSNEYRGFTRKMMKRVQLKPYESGFKTPTREDLIYFEESPDFCLPNYKYGFMGTQGRACNATSNGFDGCHLLCCGRGYVTEEVEEYERCNCTFHWCCQVNCKICKVKKKKYRCI